MNERIKQIAESAGANLAPASISGKENELRSFEVLASGEVEVTLADGQILRVASRRDADDNLPAGALTAESFLVLMGSLGAALPLGASPVGRRFYARRVIASNGKAGLHFSEAGRDV